MAQGLVAPGHVESSRIRLGIEPVHSVLAGGFFFFFTAESFLVAQTIKNLSAVQETQVCWIRKIPWRKKRQPTPVLLPGEFHGQRSLDRTVVHGVTKSWM